MSGVSIFREHWLESLGGIWREALVNVISTLRLKPGRETNWGRESWQDFSLEANQLVDHLFLASWRLGPWISPPSQLERHRLIKMIEGLGGDERKELPFSICAWGRVCLSLRESGQGVLAAGLFAQVQCLDAWLSPLASGKGRLEPTFRAFELPGRHLIGCARHATSGELYVHPISSGEAALIDALSEHHPDEPPRRHEDLVRVAGPEVVALLLDRGWLKLTP
jgi:hypothetical protein